MSTRWRDHKIQVDADVSPRCDPTLGAFAIWDIKQHCLNPIHSDTPSIRFGLSHFFITWAFEYTCACGLKIVEAPNPESAEAADAPSCRALNRQRFEAAEQLLTPHYVCTAFWILSYSVKAPRMVKAKASRSVTTLKHPQASKRPSTGRCWQKRRTKTQSSWNAFDTNRLRRLIVRDFHYIIAEARPWTLWSSDI